MNIKQAQQLSGVSTDNIRFYEKQGLLCPKRNQANRYRDYSAEDIQTLKLIRALRMLDLPLPQVAEVLNGTLSLSDAALEQQQRLEEQMAQLDGALRLCKELAHSEATMDVDTLLTRMDEHPQEGFFRGWLEDYRRVADAEQKTCFSFIPDEVVTTPREFTDALLAYALEQHLNLTVTSESMRPTFTIDGIEYTAELLYRRTLYTPAFTNVLCRATHPEELEVKEVPTSRRSLQKFLHRAPLPALLALLFLVVCLSTFQPNSFGEWFVVIVLPPLIFLLAFLSHNKFT